MSFRSYTRSAGGHSNEGCALPGLSVARVTLEDVYLRLTREDQ